MQTETHYTSQVKRSGAPILVFRKAGNVHVGTITQLHRGWEANLRCCTAAGKPTLGAGIRRAYGTKIEAFTAIVENDQAK